MFKFRDINSKKILVSDILPEHKAIHLFTTRDTVVTPKDIKELEQQARENLEIIAKYLNIAPENIISPEQTHSANIAVAKAGCNYPETDALVVEDKNIAVLLNFADCTPIILYDEDKNIGAVVHAGWRGTAAEIVKKTVQFMAKKYKTSPKDIVALIGPAISAKNYQVDMPVFEQLSATLNKPYEDCFSFDKESGKYNADLKTINKHQLEELGVERIDKCKYCTYDSIDVFFSYRKEAGKTARHSAVLKLIDK